MKSAQWGMWGGGGLFQWPVSAVLKVFLRQQEAIDGWECSPMEGEQAGLHTHRTDLSSSVTL